MNEYFPPAIPGRVFGIPSSLVGPKVLATLPPLVEVAVWLDLFPPKTVKNKQKYIKPRINDFQLKIRYVYKKKYGDTSCARSRFWIFPVISF